MFALNQLFQSKSVGFLFLLTAVFYAISLSFPFYFDDYPMILGNAEIRNFDIFKELRFWLNVNNRPLSFLSFAINYKYFLLEIESYRLVNIFIHLANYFFAYLLANEILRFSAIDEKKGKRFLLIIVAIFALHPLQSQAVIYITQRMALLAALFSMSSMYFYLVWRKKQIAKNKKHFIWIFLAIVSMVLALLSKQNTALLPVLILAFDFLLFREKNQKIRWLIVGFGGVAILISVLFFMNEILHYSSLYRDVSRWQYFQTQWLVIPTYIFWWFLPYFQSIDPYINWVSDFNDYRFWLGAAFMILALWALVQTLFKGPMILKLAVTWIVLTLFIESSFLPIKDAIAVHRMHLPMFGFGLIGAHFLAKINKEFVAWILVAYFSIFLLQRIYIWSNPERLWNDAIAKYPENRRPYNNLGVYYEQANDYEKAKEYYLLSLNADSTYYSALNNLGTLYLKDENYDQAIHYLQKSLMYNNINPQALVNIGLAWKKIGVKSEAYRYFERAIRHKPQLKEAYFNLAVVEELMGKTDEAKTHYRKAITMDEAYFDALYNLGNLHLNYQEYETAVTYFLRAIAIEATNENALNNLAICYFQLGEKEKSIAFLQKIIALNPSNQQALSNLEFIKLK